jgi:hypothetical protein
MPQFENKRRNDSADSDGFRYDETCGCRGCRLTRAWKEVGVAITIVDREPRRAR